MKDLQNKLHRSAKEMAQHIPATYRTEYKPEGQVFLLHRPGSSYKKTKTVTEKKQLVIMKSNCEID